VYTPSFWHEWMLAYTYIRFSITFPVSQYTISGYEHNLEHVLEVSHYLDRTMVRNEVTVDNTDYDPLRGGEQICPERHANIFSSEWTEAFAPNNIYTWLFFYPCYPITLLGIFFAWMTPLMQQGYKRPITDKDIWKLDNWDGTETLHNLRIIWVISVYEHKHS
jgi:hypothetical protein